MSMGLKAAVAARGGIRSWVAVGSLAVVAVAVSACGFHLRGSAQDGFPPEARSMRVVVKNNREAYGALRLAMRSALQRSGVTVTESGDGLLLTLTEENFENQVLSVNAAGAGREYLIRYEVAYRLTDSAGKERVAGDTVRVLREQLVEPAAILAREIEERELREAMRQEAAQQIVRRLARSLAPPSSATK